MEVGGGGRYDHLIGRFGRNIPSTGFALNVDRLFRGLALSIEPAEAGRLDVLVVASPTSAIKGFAVARMLRQSHQRVAQQIIAASGKNLIAAAEDAGVQEDTRVVVIVEGEGRNDQVMVAERLNGRFSFSKSTTSIDQMARDMRRRSAPKRKP